MKKILAIFLALSMLLAMLTVPTFADNGDANSNVTLPTPQQVRDLTDYQDGDTVLIDGHNYTVIRKLATFLSINNVDGDAYYILGEDISFDGKAQAITGAYGTGSCGVINGKDHNGFGGTFHFEGNGYALNDVAVGQSTGSGIFAVSKGDKVTISNLTVNVTTAVNFTANCAGLLFGTSADDTSGASSLTLKNIAVNLNANFSASANNAVFVSKARCPLSITGCTLTVKDGCTVSFTGNNAGKGALVGLVDKGLTYTIDNCHINGNFNVTAQRAAAFVGKAEGSATLKITNSTLNGTCVFTANQAGGFVGFVGGSANLVFENCKSYATVIAKTNRVSPFVGQQFNSGTAKFTQCHVGGVLVSNSYWNGGFMGVAGGSWSGDNINWSIASATVTFTNCSADILVIGQNSSSAYVGSNAGGVPTINFNGCTNESTVYSVGSAGSWVAEIEARADGKDGSAQVYFDKVEENDPNSAKYDPDYVECTSNAKIYSKTLFAGDNTTAYTQINDKAMEDGSFAYAIAQAQKAAGVAADYIYGQTIGTDATPVFGGKTVYEIDTKMAETFYSNTIKGVYTVDKGDGNATAYSQVAKNGDKYNSRVIISVATAELEKVAAMEITLTYNLIDGSTKTFTVNKDQVSAYYSVYADDMVAEAADGYLLLAIVVKNIPNDVWSGNEADVVVGMTATDAEGAPIAAYTIGA